MTLMWDSEPVVAASDFCPFTREVAMPVPMPIAGRDASTRVRAALKGGAVTRPVRRNLLEMGLACGQGAAELEARALEDDAAERKADRAAGVDASTPAEEGDEAAADNRAPDPAALEALATEIQTIVRKRDKLAEELAGLDRQRAELQAELMALLGEAGLRPPPAAPAPPALPPGTGLPTHRWNRTD